MSLDWQARFPGFRFGRHITTSANIIIADIPVDDAVREALCTIELVSGINPVVLDSIELTTGLLQLLEPVDIALRTLYVFPGDGASHVQSLLRPPFLPAAPVTAKRWWSPGDDPFVYAAEIMPQRFLAPEFRRLVVIDDVISSGQTMERLWERSAWKFPRACWVGACWVAQVPRTRCLSGVRGYESIRAAVVVEGPSGKRVPINSLSTLVEDVDIAESYMSRHCRRPEQLATILKQLR